MTRRSLVHHRPRAGREFAWKSPDGTWYLVRAREGSYVLTAPEEAEGLGELLLEADLDGRITVDGEPTGWRLPAELRGRIRRRTSV